MKDETPLSYGLRPGVLCFRNRSGIGMVLPYPLKVMLLNLHWAPVLDVLSRSEWVRFGEVLASVDAVEPNGVELFLNDLVRRGFLESKGAARVTECPLVSVVIPVRNRPLDIQACLRSLEQLDYPQERLDIRVVDDASTDSTPSAAASFNARVIPLKTRRGASFCRNLGAREAAGEIIAFLDSDCTVERGWLRELLPAFKDPKVAGVGGWVDSFYQEKALDRYEKVKSSLFMGAWPKASSAKNRFFYVPSCNLLARKNDFLRVGGFDESLSVGEDVDLCWRLQDLGHRIEYRPSGRVFHKHRNAIGSFCRRRFDYGTSEPLLQKTHKDREKKVLFPRASVLFWSLIALSAIFPPALCLGAAGITLILHANGACRKSLSRGVPLDLWRVVQAIGRSHAAFLYHLCAFASRYYLLPSCIFVPWFPLVPSVIWGMHAVVATTEAINKRPRLRPLSFFWFFTLEQLSYQSGVWWACLVNLNFNPVNPRVVSETP